MALCHYSLAMDLDPDYIVAIIDVSANLDKTARDNIRSCIQKIVETASEKNLYIDMTGKRTLNCIIITSLGYVIGMSEHKDFIRKKLADAPGKQASVKKAISSGKKAAGTTKTANGYEKK